MISGLDSKLQNIIDNYNASTNVKLFLCGSSISTMEDILSEIKQKDIDRVVFKNEQLHRFFPTSYTAEQMRREILEILKIWMNNNWNE